MPCPHESTISAISARHAAHRTATSASLLTAQIDIGDAKVACQNECGDASPWRGLTITPLTEHAAAARLDAQRRGILHQELRDVADAVRAWKRRRFSRAA